MLAEAKVKIALRWNDDRVSAFDENGREIADLAGSYESVRSEIFARSYAKTVFRRAVPVMSMRIVEVSKETW